MQSATKPSGRRAGFARAMVLAGAISLALAMLTTGNLSLFPPRLKTSELQVAAATTHVMIDTGGLSAVHRIEDRVPGLTKRAELFGRVLVSPPIVARIARMAHVPPDELAASARFTADLPQAFTEPASEQRAVELLTSGSRYRIEAQARQATPVLDIHTQAPTVAAAENIANAAVVALRAQVAEVAVERGYSDSEPIRLRQLDTARGGLVSGGMPVAIGVLTFIVSFSLLAAAWLYFAPRRRRTDAAPARPRLAAAGDWPRTTRLLPWAFAAFLAMLWLTPFNDIELNVNAPIDLKLDRLILPFVALAWILALVFGARGALRGRITIIHVAVGAFLLCAFTSVALNAQYLTHTLELQASIKGLPLLLSYVSLFFIAATSIRRVEVDAFLKYTLVLAVICALGMLYEYRFGHNLFYEWSDKLLPGNFTVKHLVPGGLDSDGRRMVRGPAALSLEAVAMLSMALPIALVGVMNSVRSRDRFLHGLAACLMMAAMFATFRKSALLVPASVILTVACFRRRELMKLAPLGLLVLVLVHVLAPGALGSTTKQFGLDRLAASTVSARTADYDAIRPDLWSHLVFGRGWGAYDHLSYRILDSEILHRVMEMGIIGMLAFVFMSIAVLIGTRATIVSRDPASAPQALACAAAAVAFLTVSFLFDSLAFPHTAYIFLYMAGLVTVVISEREERVAAAAEARRRRVPLRHGRRHAAERPKRPARRVPQEA